MKVGRVAEQKGFKLIRSIHTSRCLDKSMIGMTYKSGIPDEIAFTVSDFFLHSQLNPRLSEGLRKQHDSSLEPGIREENDQYLPSRNNLLSTNSKVCRLRIRARFPSSFSELQLLLKGVVILAVIEEQYAPTLSIIQKSSTSPLGKSLGERVRGHLVRE